MPHVHSHSHTHTHAHGHSRSALAQESPAGTCNFSRYTDRPVETIAAWWEGSHVPSSGCTAREPCCSDDGNNVTTCSMDMSQSECKLYAWDNHIHWQK